MGAFPDHEDDGFDEQPDEIEQLCRSALVNLDDGDLEAARTAAMQAVEIDADHPFPVFVLGLIADQEGDIDVARYLSERALQNAGTNADTIQFRAQIHLREHEFDRAEDLLRFGIAHNPDDASLHEQLARMLLAMGRYEEAARAANVALEIDPADVDAHRIRMAALDGGGDDEAMLAAMRQSVQMHPDDPYAAIELAHFEAQVGNLDRARVLLARAERIAKHDFVLEHSMQVILDSYDTPLLRPLPALMRWMRMIPGGLVGFLLAYLVVSMPLGALAAVEPAYAIPARALLVAWGLVAAYIWIAPALLTCRRARRAAVMSRTLLEHSDVDRERIADTAIAYLHGKQFSETVRVLTSYAGELPDADAELVRAVASQVGARWSRAFARVASIPGDVRTLIAVGVVSGVHSGMLARITGIAADRFLMLTFACLVVAWAIAQREAVVHQRLADIVEAPVADR